MTERERRLLKRIVQRQGILIENTHELRTVLHGYSGATPETPKEAWEQTIGEVRRIVAEVHRVPTLLARVDAAFSHEAHDTEQMELYAIYRWAERLHGLVDSGERGAIVGRVTIGWIGDVHSGTLRCECGWEQFCRERELDDLEAEHRRSHGEDPSHSGDVQGGDG